MKEVKVFVDGKELTKVHMVKYIRKDLIREGEYREYDSPEIPDPDYIAVYVSPERVCLRVEGEE